MALKKYQLVNFLTFVIVFITTSCPWSDTTSFFIKLDRADDTYTTFDSLSYSKRFNNGLKVYMLNQYSSKTVNLQSEQDLRGNNKINVDQKSLLKLNYSILKDLSLGGGLRAVKIFDNLNNHTNRSYNVHSTYNPAEEFNLYQSLGTVEESRFGGEDKGISYLAALHGDIPWKEGTHLNYNINISGDNLLWNSQIMNFDINYTRTFQRKDTLWVIYTQDWAKNTILRFGGIDRKTYIRRPFMNAVVGSTVYSVTDQVKLGINGKYLKNKLESEGDIGFNQSIDFLSEKFELGLDLKKGDFKNFTVRSGFSFGIQWKDFENETRNERIEGFKMSARLNILAGRLDSLQLTGNIDKASIYDVFDKSDDRDDRTITVGAVYPVHFGKSVTGNLIGNVSITDIIHLDELKSLESKRKTLYRLSPELKYALSPRISYRQVYILSAYYLTNLIENILDTNYAVLNDNIYRTFSVKNNLYFQLNGNNELFISYNFEEVNSAFFEGGLFNQKEFKRDTFRNKWKHIFNMSYTTRLFDRIRLSPHFSYYFNREVNYGADSDTNSEQKIANRHFAVNISHKIVNRIFVDLYFRNIVRIREGRVFPADNYMNVTLNATL